MAVACRPEFWINTCGVEATGVGMAGMRERAAALGGRLEIETLETGPEHGTALKVTIPSRNFR